MRITAGRNVIDHLTSDVHGDRLTLGSDGSMHSFGPVRYDLVLPAARVVDLSGSGQVTVDGSTTGQRISIGGSGRYSGGGLASQDAHVTISGSGSADVTVSRTLSATISGSGSVTYTGDAAVTSSVTGSGPLVRR